MIEQTELESALELLDWIEDGSGLPYQPKVTGFMRKALTAYMKEKPHIDAILEAREMATDGEWELWNGCSWNRFGIKHEITPFIYPYINQRDRHEELAICERDSTFITTAANEMTKIMELREVNDDES